MLTKQQHKLLLFVHNFIQTNGIAPSFEEMFKALDLKSKSSIHRLLDALVERGFIRRLIGRARAIEVIKLPEDFKNGTAGCFAGIKFIVNPAVPDGEIWVGNEKGIQRFAVGQ